MFSNQKDFSYYLFNKTAFEDEPRDSDHFFTRDKTLSAPPRLFPGLSSIEIDFQDPECHERSIDLINFKQQELVHTNSQLHNKIFDKDESTLNVSGPAVHPQADIQFDDCSTSLLDCILDREKPTEFSPQELIPVPHCAKIKKQKGCMRPRIVSECMLEMKASKKSRGKFFKGERRSRLEIKVRRVSQYWSKESKFSPNIFKTTASADEPDKVFEFQDYSAKEVLAEGLLDLF